MTRGLRSVTSSELLYDPYSAVPKSVSGMVVRNA